MKHPFRTAVVALIAALLLPAVAPAAELDTEEDEGFSAYAVARLKIFEGTVWVRTPDSGDWEEFLHNSPVPERSRISVPKDSEAELQFHGGQYVLLTGGTEVDLRVLADERSVFRLRSGEIRFDLPEDDFAPTRVVLPAGAKSAFNVPGRYWLTAEEDGDSRLVVRRGEAQIEAEGRGQFTVRAGEVASIGDAVRISPYRAERDDDDEYAPAPPSGAETEAGVPPSVAYDLRDYGEWVSVPTYGWAWRPRVVVGWSPFFYGRWSWVSPYGWTWISFEPWGWYPYRCGYWFSDPTFGWCWSPYRSFVSVGFTFGGRRYHHYHRNVNYYPARVRFVRDGGSYRWVPLRPGERFSRPRFTRTDTRLVRWERPLTRGTVFVRHGAGRTGEWRDWTDARLERKGPARVIRDRNIRAVVRGVDAPGRGPAVKPPARVAPEPRKGRIGAPRDGTAERGIRQPGKVRERPPAVRERPQGEKAIRPPAVRERPQGEKAIRPPAVRERPQGEKVIRPPAGGGTGPERPPRYEREIRPAPGGDRSGRGKDAVGSRVVAPPARGAASPPFTPPRRIESRPEVQVPRERPAQRESAPPARVQPSPGRSEDAAPRGRGNEGGGRSEPGDRGGRGQGGR